MLEIFRLCAIFSGCETENLIRILEMLDFSVITAVWNAEKTIAACLESVRINQLDRTEQLILDNCSEDRTAEIVRKYPSAVLHTGKDSGIYNAMNKGIRLAENEILVFLNADDFFLAGTLAKVRNAFETHPESDIVYGNLLVNGRTVKPASGLSSFGGARIFHPAAFIRRSLFEKLGGYDEQYRICADLDFFLRAKEAGAVFTYLDEPLTDFALGGISTTARKRTAQEVRSILISHGYSRIFAGIWYFSMRLRGWCSGVIGKIRKH